MAFSEFLTGLSNLMEGMPGAISQGLIWGIMAIGVYITYKMLDIADLTVDGTLCTGGAVCVLMLTSGHSIAASIIVAFLAGMAAGFVTGLFHTAMGIPAILASILTQLSLYSVNLKLMGGGSYNLNSRIYKRLVSLNNVSTLPLTQNTIFIVAIFVIALIGILYWFFGTEFGCALRATGCNLNMSRAQGINTSFNKVFGLMLSNGIVALSGALLAQYQSFAEVQMGRGAIVIGLAAVIIGEVLLGRIFRNFALKLVSVVVGAIVYFIVYQIVIFLRADTDLLKLMSAIIVAIFLAVPYWKAKYFARKRKEDRVHA